MTEWTFRDRLFRGAVLAVAGDTTLSAWVLDAHGSVGASWNEPTFDLPIEHLAVVAARRTSAVVVVGGPEGLKTVMLDTECGPLRSVLLADTPVTALSVAEYPDGQSSLVVAGTDDGVLAVCTVGPDGPGRLHQYAVSESLTHAVILGSDELAKGVAQVKDLAAGTQKEVPLKELAALFKP